MEWALVLLEVCGAEAVSDYHVIAFENLLDHGWGGIGRVGIVTVGHDIDISIDVLEHRADDIPLALAGLLTDDYTFSRGDFRGVICGVVVVDVDSGVRQCHLEVPDDFTDGDFFVVTGEKYRNLRFFVLNWHVYHYSRDGGRRIVRVY